MLRRIMLFAFLLIGFGLSAQQIDRFAITSAAEQFETEFGYMSYSFGQALSTTLNGSEFVFTQGFQQPDDPKVKPNSVDLIPTDEFAVYPVPSQGQFYLNLKEPASENLVISIISMGGSLVQSKQINMGTQPVIPFNLSNRPSGVYFLQMINEKKTLLINEKIVIQK